MHHIVLCVYYTHIGVLEILKVYLSYLIYRELRELELGQGKIDGQPNVNIKE